MEDNNKKMTPESSRESSHEKHVKAGKEGAEARWGHEGKKAEAGRSEEARSEAAPESERKGKSEDQW